MCSFKKLTCLICLLGYMNTGQAQTDYLIHKRGMLNQAVYKTGALGRLAYQNAGTTEPGVPSFEWPAHSALTLDGITYTGQHNSFGGGVQIGATPVDTIARARLYAYCGGGTNALPQQNSFPIPGAEKRIENYPVLENGDLNPAYNPDEAEEIIVTQWATPVGVTIKRTSRAWSFPDYDDFIIYEYEFENTGDLDGVPSSPKNPVKLVDLIINFSHGLTGGKFGYDRSGSWSQIGIAGKDYQAHFDQQRWLQYGLHRTGNPEKTYFIDWASTGKYGGGLLSPQAPGFMVLYYDTLHLAHKSETAVKFANPLTEDPVSWDSHLHLKQPYYNGVETAQLDGPRTKTKVLDISGVRANPSITDSVTYGRDWLGRGEFNWRQSLPQAVGRNWAFGPYVLKPGEKIRITIAEVCGYGAARDAETVAGMTYGRTYLHDVGGSTGNVSTDGRIGEAGTPSFAFYGVPNYWVIHPQKDLNPLTLNPTISHGSDYLTKYSRPEYLNSDVITVREVADRAIQAYTGGPSINHDDSTQQYWPEKYSDHGKYALPIPVPAPEIVVENTAQGENRIAWGPQVESFTTLRLQGVFDHYELYKSAHPLGHWQKLAAVAKRDLAYFANGKYQFTDKNTRVGDKWYYSVLSVDDHGNTSGRTNLTLHESAIGATQSLEQVYIAPNPFLVKSGYTGAGDVNTQLRFYNLPKACTIRIFSFSGQLVQTIEHDENNIQHPYVQITRNNQLIASGVYFYSVNTPDGSRCHGTFVIIN
ncbi:MAG: T9SS type A sorting domain-containing protein [Ignavibacteriales bacterium]|nr:T9SS type A sorting domain-containing protein [Ignavibacteriales bacterium]